MAFGKKKQIKEIDDLFNHLRKIICLWQKTTPKYQTHIRYNGEFCSASHYSEVKQLSWWARQAS